jgi:HD-GYP domain-containing protein (c-di-GMP phosphodiesterase class II)
MPTLQTATPNERAAAERIPLSEVLGALSHALDLTEGQPLGHSVRACAIGMRLASEAGLDQSERAALYYALLLKDAGCSSNAARMSAIFGSDDRFVKPRLKVVDWDDRLRLAIDTWHSVAVGKPLFERAKYFIGVARTDGLTRDSIRVRCERGAEVARYLRLPEATAEAIRSLDEHWNGRGYPEGLAGAAIPIGARILNIAQTVEVFHATAGIAMAMRVVRDRRGTWFDPALADLVVRWELDAGWWTRVAMADYNPTAMGIDTSPYERWIDDAALDVVAVAFADIIDAKSPFTYRHSSNVARFATGIIRQRGLDVETEVRMARAGLLHDIGKVGISNRILDKPGPLTVAERSEVERHPDFTWQILSRIGAFESFARTASLHHEKLDGSGYPWRLTGGQLDPTSRALAVADAYEALTANRPYREGLGHDRTIEILRRDCVSGRLCGTSLDALVSYVEELERPTVL